MAKELVLVSHGRFCEELKASTEMIMGPQESIHTVALLPEEGPEDFTAKFEATVQGLEDYIVFADLLGGTPCNTVSRLILEGRAIDLYAGMNLPMVIDVVSQLGEDADADVLCEGTLEPSKDAIIDVNAWMKELGILE